MPKKRPNSIKFVPERCPVGVETKQAVSVSEMAKMLSLSRGRFYQLIGTAFPHPVYNVSTRRPYYDQEAQELCLEVRRRNCGIDGKPILFYARHAPKAAPKKRPAPNDQKPNIELLEGLKSLGLVVTAAQVEAAIKELFPRGEPDLRAVFLHLQKKSR